MTEQPTAPPTPAAAAPAAPAAAQTPAAPAVPAASATDPAAEIARLQAQIDEWKGHSRTWEQRAKANAEAAQGKQVGEDQLKKIAEALGLAPEQPDPAKITEQLQRAQAEKAELARQNAVLLAAHSAGADAAALLDSKSFLNAISNVDPTDAAAVKAAVEAAVAANPRYAVAAPAAAPAPVPAASVPTSSAGSFSGAPGAARQLGEQDVKAMSGADLSKAAKQGLLANYFATPN